MCRRSCGSLAVLLRIVIIWEMLDRRPPAPTSTGQELLPAIDASELRVRAVPSSALFGACRELLIEHAGSLYHLRITQNNKLILTK